MYVPQSLHKVAASGITIAMRTFYLTYILALLLLPACKRTKDDALPETTFEYTVFENGLIKFAPSNGTGTQEWNFGDNPELITGNPGAPVYHIFAENGTYSVKLKTTSGLGGVAEFNLQIEIVNVPTRAFITKIQLNSYTDSVYAQDSVTDIYFQIKKYDENSSSNLYTSNVYSNYDPADLPLITDLSGSKRIEFPVDNFLISVIALDDNSGNPEADNELGYLAWYDHSHRPPESGITFTSETDIPEYYPTEIATSEMSVSLEWE